MEQGSEASRKIQCQRSLACESINRAAQAAARQYMKSNQTINTSERYFNFNETTNNTMAKAIGIVSIDKLLKNFFF